LWGVTHQGWRAAALRAYSSARDLPRRSPVTCGYLALLALTDVLVHHLLPPATRARLLLDISTNLDNLGRHPVRSLVASMLVIDTRAAFLDDVLIVGLGIAACLGWLERRAGSLRAAGVFVFGHVTATLVAAVVLLAAIHGGSYPRSVEHSLDYGVSYGSITAVTAITWYLPRRTRAFWAALCVLYPLTDTTWYGWVPDFTTVGHMAGALCGLAAGLAVRRRTSRTEPRGSAGTRPGCVSDDTRTASF
jgi:hypothetical protein